jgi:hypothetical protein
MESDRIRLTAGVDSSPSGEWSGLLALFLSVYLGMALISLLGKAFPNANLDWLWFVLLLGMFAGVIGVLVYIGLQRVWIEPTGACVTFGNKPIWGISASQLQFIALVGNDTEAALCLSAKTIDELAALREKQLLKNWLSKDEVPLRKRRAEWRETFAKEYMLYAFRKSQFTVRRKSGLILVPANITLLTCIRALYPDVPYYAMTNQLRKGSTETVSRPHIPGTMEHYARIQPQGIHIDHFKKEVGFMQGEQIQTVVHVTHFYNDHRSKSSHAVPILMVCTIALEELAQSVPKTLYGAETIRLGMDMETLATIYCYHRYHKWSEQNKWMYPLQDTPAIRQQLQEYYPNAQWVDLSDRWMKNSDISGG